MERFFPETTRLIRGYLDPWIALNRRASRAMILPLAGCALAILWGAKNILAILY